MIRPLFCKPAGKDFMFQYEWKEKNSWIAWRSMNVWEDGPLIHEWVNREYAKAFWNMTGSIGLFQSCYQCIMQNPYAHSFIACWKGQVTAQLDLYKVIADELAGHVDAAEDDCGFHLIMAPIQRNNLPAKGLTLTIIQSFLDWYFTFPQAKVMWAEPDSSNAKSIRLLRALGFEYVKTIQMSYKEALVYRRSR
jgi:acetyl CoA:N6-hydroxylysine acetyl transferase